MNKQELLRAEKLQIAFADRKKTNEVVHEISFSMQQGEVLGIVGESGSGKSVTALSILGLLAAEGKITSGNIFFEGRDLTHLSEKELEKVRGNEISYVFQEPMTSLNPVLTIGYQLEEMLILHEQLSKEQRKNRMLSMLSEVGLLNGEELLLKYPHQLSGGMRQRIMIAIAMITHPKLLIADEPTTALDVTVQAKVLKLLADLNKTHGTGILLISHDLSVIRKVCSRVIVMCDGNIEEQGTVEEIFANPQKEYTKKLLAAALHVHDMTEDIEMLSAANVSSPVINREHKEREYEAYNPILTVQDVRVYYKEKKSGMFGKTALHEIVKGVSFEIYPGEIFGIVGESGSGKSTIAKAVVGLNRDVTGVLQCTADRPQMVFQDPYGSLNPSKTIGWLLEEPLRLSKKYSKAKRKKTALAMLNKVGLQESYYSRYPSDLSGGQRQRVAIAMAVILDQKLVVLDEPVSALDVTIQEQILELLLSLRMEFGLSYLFISHDMGVIQKMCDRVGVMYQGNLIEVKETKELFLHPEQEYTKRLLDAVL